MDAILILKNKKERERAIKKLFSYFPMGLSQVFNTQFILSTKTVYHKNTYTNEE